MTDIGFALQAKSDQLNADDIIGAEPIIKITEVRTQQSSDQPVSIYYDGCNNRPWRPSKGMLRVLAKAWGRDSQQWIGRHAKIYNEPTVKYGGKEVGGIRIRALTDIDKNGVQFSLAVARNKREPFLVQLLEVETTPYPDDKFNQALPVMVEKMQSGEWTLQQVIARCQQTGALSQEQLSKLEEAAPTIIEDNNDAEPI